MKGNFMKKLKKELRRGIVIGMTGAIVTTNQFTGFASNSVISVSAKIADIENAGTLEKAKLKFSEEVVFYILRAKTNCETVRDKYEAFYKIYKSLGTSSTKNKKLFDNLNWIMSGTDGIDDIVGSIENIYYQYKGREDISDSEAEDILNSLDEIDAKYRELYSLVHDIAYGIEAGSNTRYDDFNVFSKFYDNFSTVIFKEMNNINSAREALESWTHKPLSLKFVWGFELNGKTEQPIGGVNHEGDTTWISKNNVPDREGYVFTGWTCNCGSLAYDPNREGYTYTFGSKDAVITANWEKIEVVPTIIPSIPTAEPTIKPTVGPIVIPTVESVVIPTIEPTVIPTIKPTAEPTIIPTVEPATKPTVKPTIKVEPTVEPIVISTMEPVVTPTVEPTVIPTIEPTVIPTIEPTVIPTIKPTAEPTIIPTVEPATKPTVEPTIEPTVKPTIKVELTVEPTMIPTIKPTVEPILVATIAPTTQAAVTVIPTTQATVMGEPTVAPLTVTAKPTAKTKAISLKKKVLKISKGEKVIIPLINKAGKKIAYFSKNKKIATITRKGIVKGIKEGTTTVYAKANGKKCSLKVIVTKKKLKKVKVK